MFGGFGINGEVVQRIVEEDSNPDHVPQQHLNQMEVVVQDRDQKIDLVIPKVAEEGNVAC